MDLLGEPGEAQVWAERAIRLAREQEAEVSLSHAYIVRAIARLHADAPEPELARQDFERARATSRFLVALNLAALEQRDTPDVAPGNPSEDMDYEPETIAGLHRDQFTSILRDADVSTEVPRSGSQPSLDVYARYAAGYQALIVEAGYTPYAFIATAPGYGGASARGIHVGDDIGRVEEAYGAPRYVVAHSQGVDRVYQRPHIIFRTGADEQVRGWVVYREPQ